MGKRLLNVKKYDETLTEMFGKRSSVGDACGVRTDFGHNAGIGGGDEELIMKLKKLKYLHPTKRIRVFG